MNKTFRSCALVGLLSATTITITGCGSSDSTQAKSDGAPSSTASPNVAGVVDTSSDLQPKISDSTDSAPQQIVAVFLDSLRRGDEVTANSLLTTQARAELQKIEYQIQPLGTPQGEFKIGRLVFPYQDQPLFALVESQWREPATKTDPELLMDIVCDVRQEGADWRIAGMAVTVAGEDVPLVIDFEDSQRLQQQLTIADAQPSGQQATGTQPLQSGFVAGQQSPTLPSLDQSQVGQQSPPNGFQATGAQPALSLDNLPQLPAFPNNSGNQIASPPSGNVLR